jgi:hypothetical protein
MVASQDFDGELILPSSSVDVGDRRLAVVSQWRTLIGTGEHCSIASAIKFSWESAGGVTEPVTKLSRETSIVAKT